MSSISSLGQSLGATAATSTAAMPAERSDAAPAPVESATGTDSNGNSGSSVVSLSPTGRVLSAGSGKQAGATGQNDDIDDSDLPDSIKDVLKLIRKLQAELRQKQQEMAAVQADPSLNAEQKRARLQEIQTAVSVLNGALMAASGILRKLITEQGLTQEQGATVGMLLSKG